MDNTKKVQVKTGNGKSIQVEEKRKIKLEIEAGKYRVLEGVQFVPDLDYNLLSMGQLMRAGYRLIFDDDVCTIIYKITCEVIYKIAMAGNNLFPLEVGHHKPGPKVLTTAGQDESL
jgi:hypothetical protein